MSRKILFFSKKLVRVFKNLDRVGCGKSVRERAPLMRPAPEGMSTVCSLDSYFFSFWMSSMTANLPTLVTPAAPICTSAKRMPTTK